MLLVPIFQLFLCLLLQHLFRPLLLPVLGLQFDDLSFFPKLDDLWVLFGLVAVAGDVRGGGGRGRIIIGRNYNKPEVRMGSKSRIGIHLKTDKSAVQFSDVYYSLLIT